MPWTIGTGWMIIVSPVFKYHFLLWRSQDESSEDFCLQAQAKLPCHILDPCHPTQPMNPPIHQSAFRVKPGETGRFSNSLIGSSCCRLDASDPEAKLRWVGKVRFIYLKGLKGHDVWFKSCQRCLLDEYMAWYKKTRILLSCAAIFWVPTVSYEKQLPQISMVDGY